jgi:dipeptidyl aminopeptidase/acylaminoacyl peptidase
MSRRALTTILTLPVLIVVPSRSSPLDPVQPRWEQPAADPPGALPYPAAFDTREFLWSTALAVTPDGNRIGYDYRHQPADSNLSERYLPNGTPTAVVGSRVVIADRISGRTTEVCPGGNCWRPSWSPDGARLAFYSDAEGPPELWVYEVASARARRVTSATIKAKLWTGDEARWSPDGRTLFVPLAPAGEYRSPVRPRPDPGASAANPAAVTALASGTEAKVAPPRATATTPLAAHMLRENLADLAAVDLGSGQARILAPAGGSPRPSVLRLSASGRWLSFLSVFQEQGPTSQASTFDLAVVPTAGGPVKQVVADLPSLNDYHGLNYSWHPTDDRLVYLKGDGLWLVEVGPNGPEPARQLAPELGKLAPTIHWFTRDGRAVVVGVEPHDDRDYADARPTGLAIVPLDGGSPTRFGLNDAAWTFQSILKADERTVWQPDGWSIVVIQEERSSGERAVVRFDPATGAATVLWKGRARLDHLTGGGSHSAIVGMYQDLKTPPNIYRFASDFSSKERISEIDPRLERVSSGTAEIFETTVPRHDGTLGRVRTAVVLPAGAQRGDRLPAIVMIYPGSDRSRLAESFGAGSVLTVPNLVFTSRGFAVVLANLTLGPNREPGNPAQEMVDGLLPQLYRAAELGYVDINRLAVAGQSFGGYGTAAIISRTNLFRAAVAVSGIYDLPGTYGHLMDDGGSFWIGWSEGGQARMGSHPWANLRRYVDNSPYYQADKIFTPILLVHGDDDMAYHDAQKLFSALRRLDRPAQLVSYAGQGHVISEWKRASATDAARRMVEFLRRHLGNPSVRSVAR